MALLPTSESENDLRAWISAQYPVSEKEQIPVLRRTHGSSSDSDLRNFDCSGRGEADEELFVTAGAQPIWM